MMTPWNGMSICSNDYNTPGDFSDSRFSGVSWRISVKDGLALLSCKGIQAKGTIDDHKLLRVDFQGKQGAK
eukprot:1253758-Amorphochlora_amoeboformis.AAC.1